MNTGFKILGFLISILFISCTTETESFVVKTPPLNLQASGPFFEGTNTLSATWEYSLEELIPEMNGEIIVENVRVNTIKIVPKSDLSYPQIGQVIMQMKSENKNLSRIGLLESNFKTNQSNNLKVWQIQDNLHKAIIDEKVIFLADFEMLDNKYNDDLSFDLIVTFNVRTRK